MARGPRYFFLFFPVTHECFFIQILGFNNYYLRRTALRNEKKPKQRFIPSFESRYFIFIMFPFLSLKGAPGLDKKT